MLAQRRSCLRGLAHYPSLMLSVPDQVMGARRHGGRGHYELGTPKFVVGKSRGEWRKGVKHDGAPVMVLLDDAKRLLNESGKVVDVEPSFIFPLLKGSGLAGKERLRGRRRVIVAQQRVQGNRLLLERDAPKLWANLSAHAERIAVRKPSI